ncbi:hypothetical protein PLICRDRAFT_157547 [Plicaturopsis crispa FD-325 SS-3]|nr:hypothetical protein PLICRDRAFT_157547 [Plicaturopsis crispa FD-325 SS-3]
MPHADAGVQAGPPWAALSTKQVTSDSPTSRETLDDILLTIKNSGWTLGDFLQRLFVKTTRKDAGRSRVHASIVSQFLSGRLPVKAEDIVELMYTNHDGAAKAIRNTKSPDKELSAVRLAKKLKEREKMGAAAQSRLREWAISKVEGLVDGEADALSGKEGGFHVAVKDMTWDFVHTFSFGGIASAMQEKAPTTLRLLCAAAMDRDQRKKVLPSGLASSSFYSEHFAKPPALGSGNSRRDPLVIIVFAFVLLMGARNMNFSAFRRIFGVMLFAYTAPHGLYTVLSRLGVSVSYTTVLKLLRRLSESAKENVRKKAKSRAFLLIYDNINRMSRAWDPDVGQKDIIHNGTAATYVELEDCDVEKAFDPNTLRAAQEAQGRKKLNINVLHDRVDWGKLNKTLALQCALILVDHVPTLDKSKRHREVLELRLRVALAIHRMRRGRKSGIYPLATSNHNEGVTGENAYVLDDLATQLGLTKEEVARLLVLIGGDQSTVEKLRALKKFLATCPHGYSNYGWVLPLIQLWHMGWADLERVLRTHWGGTGVDDISSFRTVNVLLGRKVKDEKRPDYYPTQHLVFDNLKVEVLDCWKIYLGAQDLDEYFRAHPTEPEDLLKMADELYLQYLTTESYEHALRPDSEGPSKFAAGTPWTDRRPPVVEEESQPPVDFVGDQVLANTILRMRDSLIHYEFQCAIADGDIGRAMNVMAVWTFTFTGSGRSKYANELLELACNFEYEYSEWLKEGVLNNWLVNLSGLEGCWFPMDLLEEKNIKQLKKMAKRRDISFGSDFFRDIVAYNIRAFLEAKKSMESTVRLAHKGGSHRRAKKVAAMKKLTTAVEERELHKFRAGRTLGHKAQDDFEVGYLRLADSTRIEDFIARTLRDAGDIHGEGDDVETEMEDIDGAHRGPSMMMNGNLVNDLDSEHEDSDDSLSGTEDGLDEEEDE